jgi:hypothetical protein
MGKLQDLKPNKVQVLLEKYVHVVIGLRKTGKTTLFRDLVAEHYNGDLSKGLLLGLEKGYQALDGIYSQDINDWQELEDIGNELINERNSLPYRLICIDTIDEMVNMAENEALRFYNKRGTIKAYTINEAGGGYGRGRDYAKGLIRDFINKIIKAGFGLFMIGHSKDKKLKEKDGNEYNLLSSSLTNDYSDIFMDLADLITFLTIDKEIVDKKVRKTVYMNFRSDGYIDCGGRFKNLPEKVAYGAKGYLEVFDEAVKSSMLNNSKEEIDKNKKEQQEEIDENAKQFIEDSKKIPLIEIVKDRYSEVDEKTKQKVQVVMKEYNIKNFKTPKELKLDALEKIVSIIKENDKDKEG